MDDLSPAECRVYLAEHPANTLYYAGSALVFRTVFSTIADKAEDTANLTGPERMKRGVDITLADVNEANLHLNNVLYGLIKNLLGSTLDNNEDQSRIQILEAPKPTTVGLPMFVDVGSA
jgi:hypothetical protein